MHATQTNFAEAKAVYETIRDQVFDLDRDWTEDEHNAFLNAGKSFRQAADAMIQWAMEDIKNKKVKNFDMVADLDERTKGRPIQRLKLADICFRYSGR